MNRAALDRIHAQACENGLHSYTDPATGYRVFTALAHEARGNCCGCGCRHCPFGHSQVPSTKTVKNPRDPYLVGQPPPVCDVLFWSGGKDSFLALRALQQAGRSVVLLTTFEDATEVVAHQQVGLPDILAQIEAFNVPAILTPLFAGASYLDRIELALTTLGRHTRVERLAFGDLHLEHIREWRETQLGPRMRARGIELAYPIWQVPYDELSHRLAAEPVRCTVSACDPARVGDAVRVGDVYGPDLVAALPSGVDAFGENGEFHTYVRPA